MPTYEYQCQKCGHVFEAFQSITDKPLKKCSVCEGQVKRLIGAGSGLIFKGSGFYITDYKKNEHKPKSENLNTETKGKSEESKKEPKKVIDKDKS